MDAGGVGAVQKSQYRRGNEESLNAQGLPDPSAEEGDENGDHMVDGHAGRDGGFYLVLGIGQLLHIVIGGHRGQGDHCVQHIVDAAHDEGDFPGEKAVGEAIEEADDHQNQGVRHHDGLVAHLVDDAAHQGSGKEAGNGGDSKQKADGGGAGAIKQDQHIGAEGEEDLLSCAVEHLQHIVLGVLFVEIEPALVLIGLAFAGDLWSTGR